MKHETLQTAFSERELFENKTWILSPRAFGLDRKAYDAIAGMGEAFREFYQALELLYRRSVEGKNLLRNRRLKAPWVADYFNRGKPASIQAQNLAKIWRNRQPPVIRPDLLITDDGFALTELDSVPGGIGLTAYLNGLYGATDERIIGSVDAMVDGFYDSLTDLCPDTLSPLIAIVVSDDAATYRPEMEWLAESLQAKGKRVYCVHPQDLFPLGGGLFLEIEGNPEKVHVLYRFFELYELEALPNGDFILEACANGEVEMAPPPKTFQEEKLSLALFHHHLLEDFWSETMSKNSRRMLRRLIPRSWVIDPAPLPPSGVLAGPAVGGRPLTDWLQLTEASQKERNLILKISGFHPMAEGARSVLLGSDCSREEWEEGVKEAIASGDTSLYILQEYRKPSRSVHPVYADDRTEVEREGRTRLCPYFFNTGGEMRLGGILATFCPPDKKIIHGMKDAAMLPCRLIQDATPA